MDAVEEYIAQFPDDVQGILRGVRAAILSEVPGAEEKVRAKLDPATAAPTATPFRPRSSAYKPDPYKSNPY